MVFLLFSNSSSSLLLLSPGQTYKCNNFSDVTRGDVHSSAPPSFLYLQQHQPLVSLIQTYCVSTRVPAVAVEIRDPGSWGADGQETKKWTATQEIGCECLLPMLKCIFPSTFMAIGNIDGSGGEAGDFLTPDTAASGVKILQSLLFLHPFVSGISRLLLMFQRDIPECMRKMYNRCLEESKLSERQVLQLAPTNNADLELEDRIAFDNLNATTQSLSLVVDTYAYLFGNDFFEGFDDDLTANETFLTRILAFIVDTSDKGTIISSAEEELLVYPPLDNVSEARLLDFTARWNRSIEYQKLGYFSVADIPAGANDDFIELDVLSAKIEMINDAKYEAALQGYNGLGEMWLSQRDKLRIAVERKRSGICAKVRVQMKQRAVFTREGFEAEFQLQNNGNDMSFINITISITNLETGDAASQLFAIGQQELVGLTGVSGNGSLPSATSGYATWLIMPYAEAAPIEPLRFNVGGSLEYVMDGRLQQIELYPDTIEVSPSPLLRVSYFHEYEIYGDDPFTMEVERSVPYHLAVLIQNVGNGTVVNLRLESAQPKIVENEKGLLVDFTIINAEVDGKSTEKTLVMEFEDIPAQSSKVGVWTLVSTLQGQFSDYTVR